jgi:hypothetical protein
MKPLWLPPPLSPRYRLLTPPLRELVDGWAEEMMSHGDPEMRARALIIPLSRCVQHWTAELGITPQRQFQRVRTILTATLESLGETSLSSPAMATHYAHCSQFSWYVQAYTLLGQDQGAEFFRTHEDFRHYNVMLLKLREAPYV